MAEERRKLKKGRKGGGRRPGKHPNGQEMSAALIYVLNHPVRRQILRSLNGDGKSRSPRELTEFVAASLSNLSYHTRVLKDCGVIRQTSVRPVRGVEESFFASEVSGNKLIASILAETEREDKKFRRKRKLRTRHPRGTQ
jgi:DNA-binding transcriptional ArsR family regulator